MNITRNNVIVIPAYGRDYKSKKEAESAWLAGKDFKLADYTYTRLCSIKDFAPGTMVKLKFNQLQKFVFVRTP